MGQGARDACPRWVIGTDSMADAFSAKAQQWEILPLNDTTLVTQTIMAFIDDTNLFIGQKPQQNDLKFHHAGQRNTK